MNKDASDFMVQEYDRISSAYFGLRDQMNEMFKAYLTLVGFPLTVLAAVLKLGGSGPGISISALPDIVSGLMIVVALLGLLVSLTIISMRLEMVQYARTINGVRRFFAELDSPQLKLVRYLVLPTSDAQPPFFEKWRALFWQVILIGFLDGVIAGTAIQSLVAGGGWLLVFGVGLVCAIVHLVCYRVMAWRRQKGWKTHFADSLGDSNA